MEAKKFDGGKPLLATWPRAMLLIGKVSALGKVKYGHDMNYVMGDTLGTQRPLEAGLRHIYQFLAGETYDDESDVCHLAHAACEILMSLEIFLSRPDADTRVYKSEQLSTGSRKDNHQIQPSPLTEEEVITLEDNERKAYEQLAKNK